MIMTNRVVNHLHFLTYFQLCKEKHFKVNIISYHDDTCLIIGQHKRDETCVGTHCSNDVLNIHTGRHLRHTDKCHICDRKILPKSNQE